MNAARALFPLLLALLLALPGPVRALPEDREQPIRIESDRAERDQNTGVSVYSGDVRIIQGSLRINADEVVVEVEDEQVTRITASGSPASMRQRPSRDEEIVQASARVVLYDVTREILTLEGGARVIQDETSISGERIEYHLRDRRFQAEGAEADDEPGRRVQIVLPAKRVDEQLKQDAAQDGATDAPTELPDTEAAGTDAAQGDGAEEEVDGDAGSEEPRQGL